MPIEIERKFLVPTLPPLADVKHSRIRQGFLKRGKVTVRVRTLDETGFLTVKGPTVQRSRPEYEYPVPLEHALEMLQLCDGRVIDKTRYYLPLGELTIELDVFHGALAGRAMAEVELPHEATPFTPPTWFGKEVTDDMRYANSALSEVSELPPA